MTTKEDDTRQTIIRIVYLRSKDYIKSKDRKDEPLYQM